jgi:hypothetical protein
MNERNCESEIEPPQRVCVERGDDAHARTDIRERLVRDDTMAQTLLSRAPRIKPWRWQVR